jgi:hypothetical protein
VLHPPPVEHQEALTEYPWDDKDSLDGLDEASVGTLQRMTITLLVHPTTKQVYILNLPTIQLWSLVVSACFTTEQHHETD